MSLRGLLESHKRPYPPIVPTLDEDSSVMRGLRSRLLVLLLVPLIALLCINVWLDYRAAGSASAQQDLSLQRLAPLLNDSVVAEGPPGEAPVVLLAPAIEDFLKERAPYAFWGIATLDGRVLQGEPWMYSVTPSTQEPELHSEQVGGTLYRVLAQRADTRAGPFVLLLADGSAARQDWLRLLLIKVLLPNALLMVAVALAVNWAVGQALRPLMRITRDVQRRSPSDLSEIDASTSPREVRPLVESLNRLFILLQAQSESQRRFIADAAHQLRTPLAGLQAQVEAWVQASQSVQHAKSPVQGKNSLLPGTKPHDGAITLRANELLRLREATRRTSQLATQLLALSRADAHALSAQVMQSVDLAQLCADVLAQQLDHATQLDIDLGLELDGAQPMIVPGHDWLLRELLSNLTDNAIRYTAAAHHPPNERAALDAHLPAGGHVTLIAKPYEGGFFLQVRDNGPGISPEERSKVIERFYRVPGTGGQGNGLGLAIAQEIAKLHSAQLRLQDADPAAPAGQRGLLVSVYLHAAPLEP
jgi:two-component system, OmpR family, sensor histidine kinase TctE